MKNTAEIRPGMCVGVMGLGVTGQAAVRYCLSQGATVLASDSRVAGDWPQELTALVAQHGVAWEAGNHSYAFLEKAESVIVSPGIPLEHPVVRQLQEAGVSLLGELAVAAPYLNMPVIAVTGTNGKTTVTSLIGEIVREAGKKPFVGGNIGIPIFEYLLAGEPVEVVVLEVSSFQLLLAGSFAPQVGVLLNITPDHFDRHGTLSEYAAAKMALFAHQRTDQAAVICADDPECLSRTNQIAGECLTFGTSPGCSAHIEGLTVVTTAGNDAFRYDLAGTALANGIGVSNAAAAILACRAIGIEPAVILSALRKFQPGPHRIEVVGELQGVRFVNDSKATNTGAVIAALQQTTGKVLLIAGGRDKGEDYRLLRHQVLEKTRAVILIGEAAEKIREALHGVTELRSAGSLEEAVRLGFSLAQPGDTVLLSPACASFDMFRSYAHRGSVFTEAVQHLMAETRAVAGGAQ